MDRRSFLKGVIGTAVATAAAATPFVWHEDRDYAINLAYPPGDVRRYGAKCDGFTDCSAAFRAAIADMERRGGGTIYLPIGFKS